MSLHLQLASKPKKRETIEELNTKIGYITQFASKAYFNRHCIPAVSHFSFHFSSILRVLDLISSYSSSQYSVAVVISPVLLERIGLSNTIGICSSGMTWRSMMCESFDIFSFFNALLEGVEPSYGTRILNSKRISHLK